MVGVDELTKKRRKSIAIIFFLLSIIISGCVQQKPEKVPVIEVNLSHYIISGEHVIKINSVKKTEVEIDKVKVTGSPPFPGIHAYAIYPKDGRVLISPVAYTSLNNVGDNIILYIGIEKNDLPEPGTKINVFVEVWNEKSEKLFADRGEVIW